MNDQKEKIYVIDDDPSVKRGISILLRLEGYEVEAFSSAEEFLQKEREEATGCIILDVHLDGMSGLELQEKLGSTSNQLPIIFITGQGDIPMTVQALKKGAVDFLPKPFDDQQLIDAVEVALQKSRQAKMEWEEFNCLQVLFNNLTPREMEVFKLVITGILNKQIADQLHIAEQTVKIHRGRITRKLGVKSVAEMVRLAEKAGLSAPNIDLP